ncbi:MAG: MATE family efflux transporter [Lachnospiraceae bacterium]|nr:MATE family efflux transporter [Lachnospiraceae bacterium]MDD6627922.1 MATE family efflux transporter [Lachnospiraceae bacterium]
MEEKTITNPLGVEKTGVLLRQFAIPSIIAMLVSSLYNIVDQFFIGRSVGELGNAATNISFPLSISCVAIALLFGIGGASAFNLHMGKGEKDKAVYFMGNALVMLFGCGLFLCMITQIFLEPMLRFFGSPDNVLDYAKIYTRIVSIGFPFLILTTGGGHLIRADGRPKISMLCNLTGALINTVLDAVFVFVCRWGMAGAAAATVIGQVVSACLAVWYLAHCKSVTLERQHLILQKDKVSMIAALGAAPCSNQIAMMVVQIVMNKSLKYYGSLSYYGESIPIACAGIITKVNQVFMSFIIGLSQGLQPIVSFNYGARQYERVKKGYFQAIGVAFGMALAAFCMFQFLPRQIISIFGNGSEEYYRFAVNYFRIFLFFTFANGIQPISSNFFTAIGKPKRGVFLSLTRQILFLLPLLLIFPLFMGIDGIMYAGPVADFLAAVVTVVMISRELRREEYKVKQA